MQRRLTTCGDQTATTRRDPSDSAMARLLRSRQAMALTFKDVRRLFQVAPGKKVRLRDYDPAWAGKDEFQDLKRKELKARAVEYLERNRAELAAAQENLYAADRHSVLVILQ